LAAASVAALDLEIRGAGNLLGGEQSGHMETVGFETTRSCSRRPSASSRAKRSKTTSGPR
jgi:transcription-repair coupling factor (superfamily II helicase)